MLEQSTYYILDAQGNQLSMYDYLVDTAENTAKYYLSERNIYGSSRLGTTKDVVNMFNPTTLPSYGTVGNRNYELTNHLGNVLTVINDIKYPLADNGTITSYQTGISHVFDYSPFGAPLDGRTIEQTLYQEVTTSTTTYTTEYALEEHFDSSPNWTPLTASSQVSYPSQVMRVKNTQTTKKIIGATESFTTGDGVHSLSFKSIVIPKDLCQAIIIKNSLATPQFNQNLYLQVIIRNQNGVVVATDSINVTGNYPDFLNFTATSGYTYSVEFVMRSVCRSNAVNNYFEVDDVLISYQEATTEEQTELVASGGYLWGFNSMKKDNEVKGAGNSYDFGARFYDSRLGRFLSLDNKIKEHPSESGYSSFRNSPVLYVDYDGNEWINGHTAKVKELEQKAIDNPNNKQIERQLNREKELESIADSHIKTLMSNDVSLYNYIDNLQVQTREGCKNVKVTVSVQELDFDVTWEAKTSYRDAGERVGYDNLEGYYSGFRAPIDKNGEIGFEILFNGKSENRDKTLANEIGDVMFRMEYPKAAKESGSDEGKTDSEYRSKGAGRYSIEVENIYMKRKKSGEGKESKNNPYPIENTKD